MPLRDPPALPPKGGNVCADPTSTPPRNRFRLKVVPGPDPKPLAASSSMLETDFSILLSSLRTHLVLAQASAINCHVWESIRHEDELTVANSK